jgi:hypothetical protein
MVIYICWREGLSLRDMLSLGARKMGLGYSGKVLLLPSPMPLPSSLSPPTLSNDLSLTYVFQSISGQKGIVRTCLKENSF